MIRATAAGFILLFALAAFAQNQTSPLDDAIRNAVRIEAYKVELNRKLADAHEAERKGDPFTAAKLYQDSLDLVKKIGTSAEAEYKEVMAGLIATRLVLAEQAQRRGDFAEADAQVNFILKEDPKNERALAFKRVNEEARRAMAGKRPSEETISKMPEIYEQRVRAATLIQDGKLLYESGRLDEAEAKLNQARKLDPNNRSAYVYLDYIREQRHRQELARRENWSREKLLEVDQSWIDPPKRDALPIPNPLARTNIIYTSRGRQNIYSKLERIRLDEISYDGLPLGEVIKQLSEQAKKRDPEQRGINIITSTSLDPAPVAAPAVDPATGLPVATAVPAEGADLSTTTIRIVPALTDITLHQALDAITKVADRPIKYSIEDYAVVFSQKSAEPVPLYTRWFKVDPNTFLQGLQGVTLFDFGASGSGISGGGGSGGGGRGGGGRSGGGGGGRSRGGGGSGAGGSGDTGGTGSEYVGVSMAGFNRGGQFGGGTGAAAGTGGIGAGAQGGIRNLTAETLQQEIINVVRQFFTAAGVDLAPPKAVFFNDRSGQLMVRASLQDLDIIEQAIQVLNVPPPQITIESKIAEVTQDDSRALGFDWFLGNTLLNGGRMGVQGGTAPSFGSPALSGSFANPSGIFPGPGLVDAAGNVFLNPGFVFPSATDNVLTPGLRNTAPAIGTLTGILTDPQFRVVIRALEQRTGVDLITAPKITTLSSRQAQIKVVDVRYIVTDLDLSQTASGGAITTVPGAQTGGGAVGSAILPLAEPIELGPVLDVVPYVSADGYTIQMTIIPTLKEFVGYDDETARRFQAQAQSVGGAPSSALTQTIPLPIFRLRQVVTSAIVWDGQTVVLGGLISENVMKTKDKVPVLGDLPLAGRFFRSESFSTKKKNLLIFVTPTIIDPAGNRVHTDEELPFAQSSIPPQRVTPQP